MTAATIVGLLRKTKESGTISEVDEATVEVLRELAIPLVNGVWQLDRRQRVELAKRAVSCGAQIDTVVGTLSWKDFERFIAGVLEENNYKCIESFRRRGDSDTEGMEIDVVGVLGRRVVSVDAKMWGVRSGKTGALRTAAQRQASRTERLVTMLPRIAERLGISGGTYHLYPVLVTWLIEDVEIADGVPIVPVFKFNSFILDIEMYDDFMVSYPGELA
ncbi:MAG: hypothetical protein HXY34_11530 [Candidatus Thorarchaeota archaeon]|nr:hypothetical protein [Candidatus Thorarchaeota archaeon]